MKKFVLAAAALTATLALAGCSPQPVPAGSATPAPSPTPTPSSNLTSNGHIPKDIGEAAHVLFPGTDIDAITITVTGMTRDPECPSTMFYMPPQNGQFLAIDFEIQTSPDYLKTQPGQYPLIIDWRDWASYTSHGTKVGNTGVGFGCYEIDQMLPLELPAGQTIVAKYVLDVPLEATSFSWTPNSASDDAPGWEWQLP